MKKKSEARFEQAASAVAALLLAFAGFALWGSGKNAPAPRAREVRVAWRCVDGSAGDAGTGTCSVASDLERCTTCHDPSAHAKPAVLVGAHADLGCVACHSGDGYALEKKSAHEGLALLGKKGDEVPEVEARCAACHTETRPRASSPAKAAWARWQKTPAQGSETRDDTDYAPSLTAGRALFRSMRCGACHEARDAFESASPLEVLAVRSTPAELVHALEQHGARTQIDLALDAAGAISVASHLSVIESSDASTALPHRASVPGSSADEGKTLFEKLACAACHEALRVDISHVSETRTPDWIAYFLADPAHANPSTRMPSLRLSTREASSLAQNLVRARPPADPIDARVASRKEMVACKLPSGETKFARDACGEALVLAGKCAACHTAKPSPPGPSLAQFTTPKLVDHAGFHFDGKAKRELATYLLAQRPVRVRPDLRVPAESGEAAFASLGCAGCHAIDRVDEKRAGPSLFGEGLRVQPQWLFDFLRAPQRHGVRPPFHPEWAYRELVPAEHVTPRMPTFALDESTATSLVRFFSDRDGASFPYAAAPRPMLAGDALTSAMADLTHKDRGACLSCHTIAPPDVARARESEGKLAPPLSLAHERLRPAWVEACIAEPEVWVAGMPALAKPLEQPGRVRDLVMLLRERTTLPPAGAEGQVPALGLGDLP